MAGAASGRGGFSPIIGVDFGTTSTVVATIDGGEPRVLRDAEGLTETPSIVGLRSGDPGSELLVGRRALARQGIAVKRLLGTSRPAVLGGREYTPEQLAAQILLKLKADVERELSEPPGGAVIAVPAWFGHWERTALQAAAAAADLPLIGLLDEPVAAALAYVAHTAATADLETLLVYDFGGGKFEASVVARAGDSLVVQAVTGDRWLGGDDLDSVVVDHVRRRLVEDYGADATVDEAGQARLRRAARVARERLSRSPAVEIIEPAILRTGSGDLLHLDTTLTREEVEPLVRPYIERTVRLTRDAVASAGLTPDRVDGLLLIGGLSRDPLVAQALGDVFDVDRIRRPAHTKHEIATGAAIHAAWIAGAHAREPQPWSGRSIGYDVQVRDGHAPFVPVESEASARHPIEHRFLVPLGEERARIPLVRRGPGQAAGEPEGCLIVTLPPGVNERTPIRVQAWMDADGILRASAGLDDGRSLECSIERWGGRTSAPPVTLMSTRTDERASFAPEPDPGRPAPASQMDNLGDDDELWRRAEALVAFKEFVVSRYDWALDPIARQRLDTVTAPLQHSLDAGEAHGGLADKVRAVERVLFDQLPDAVRFLHAARWMLNKLQTEGAPAADLEDELDTIECALRAGRPSAQQDLARFGDTLRRVMQSAQEPPAAGLTAAGGGVDDRPRHARPSAREAAPRRSAGRPDMPAALTDRVHFSVTAPPVVSPGAAFTVDVWAYVEQLRAEVMERARQAAKGAEIFFREKGPVKLTRGTTLTVHLHLEGLIVDDPEDTMLWDAEVGTASFPVRAPADATRGDRPGRVIFYVEGLRIAKLHFTIAVGPVARASESIGAREERHRRAFASYAREDTDQVLDILTGMQKASPGFDVFFDRASIRSGEIWEQRLATEILARDVFYLFWSRAAAESDWVNREWRLALEHRGLQYIDPVPLVSPEIVAPPAELSRLNFDDWVLAYKRRRRASPSS
jgi:actin-like ATPase involved in cell morphogenesis